MLQSFPQAALPEDSYVTIIPTSSAANAAGLSFLAADSGWLCGAASENHKQSYSVFAILDSINCLINKKCTVRFTLHRGAFTKPLLPWKTNKYYIFLCARAWVHACVNARTRACALRPCSRTYPACNAHAPYCLLPVWLHHIFRYYLINGTSFKKKLLNIKCVFWFSLHLLLKHFSF